MDIQIRRAEIADAEAIWDIFQQENCYSETLQLPLPSLDQWKERLTNVPKNIYSLVALYNDKVIGELSLQYMEKPRRRHVASVGMVINKTDQGKGVGLKLLSVGIDLAENWLNIARIELTVYTDNVSAITLYKKLGFAIEGEAKAYAFRNGSYVDAFFMAKIRI